MDYETTDHVLWPYDGPELKNQKVTLEYRIDCGTFIEAKDLQVENMVFKSILVRANYAVLTYEYEYEPTEFDFTESDIENEIDNMLYKMEQAGKLDEEHFMLNTQPYISYEDIN